jgi:hypothetical protein
MQHPKRRFSSATSNGVVEPPMRNLGTKAFPLALRESSRRCIRYVRQSAASNKGSAGFVSTTSRVTAYKQSWKDGVPGCRRQVQNGPGDVAVIPVHYSIAGSDPLPTFPLCLRMAGGVHRRLGSIYIPTSHFLPQFCPCRLLFSCKVLAFRSRLLLGLHVLDDILAYPALRQAQALTSQGHLPLLLASPRSLSRNFP